MCVPAVPVWLVRKCSYSCDLFCQMGASMHVILARKRILIIYATDLIDVVKRMSACFELLKNYLYEKVYNKRTWILVYQSHVHAFNSITQRERYMKKTK